MLVTSLSLHTRTLAGTDPLLIGRMRTVRVEGYPQIPVTPMRKGLNPEEQKGEEARYKGEMVARNRAIAAFQGKRSMDLPKVHDAEWQAVRI